MSAVSWAGPCECHGVGRLRRCVQSVKTQPPARLTRRKKKPRWDKLLRDYGGLAGAVLLFLCICVIVALNGKAGYW